MKGRLEQAGEWLDHRTGFSAVLKSFRDEPVPGGARMWYVLGAVLTFLLLLELVTGVLLAFYYAPSAATAWASVAFIQDELTLGWFVRGLHSFGSSAMVVVTGLHLLQVLIFGAYKKPRELNWIVGLLMMLLVIVFAITGYGLPWDQKGYWAKLVEVGILGTTPVLGPALERIAQGGSAFGNFTVTHFYAVHVFVLPVVMLLLLGVHLALFRRAKVTPPWALDHRHVHALTEPYWPGQAFRDVVGVAFTLAVVSACVVQYHGAALEAPADPNGGYMARPEWYAIPLYQLRMYFKGPTEIIATMVLPGIGGGIAAALPFIDRSPTTHPLRRMPVMMGAAAGILGIGALAFLSIRHDQTDPKFVKHRADVELEARNSRALARKGVLPEGGVAVYRNDPQFVVRALWQEHCASCHSLSGAGGDEGPDFKDYNSRAWIRAFLKNPQGPLFMGPTKKDKEKAMKPVEGEQPEIDVLAELVYAESGAPDVNPALLAKAQDVFSEKDCDSCHEMDGTTDGRGPNLKGRGTLAYTVKIIEESGRPELYGKRAKMPRFAHKLGPEQIEMLAKFVLSQRS